MRAEDNLVAATALARHKRGVRRPGGTGGSAALEALVALEARRPWACSVEQQPGPAAQRPPAVREEVTAANVRTAAAAASSPYGWGAAGDPPRQAPGNLLVTGGAAAKALEAAWLLRAV